LLGLPKPVVDSHAKDAPRQFPAILELHLAFAKAGRKVALKEGIFTHPTLAEGLNVLFMTLDN
jgi:hypothetical protein